MDDKNLCCNYDDDNLEDVMRQIEEDLRQAEEEERLGIPPKPVFGMINAGPPPCEVTITDASRQIMADSLLSLGE